MENNHTQAEKTSKLTAISYGLGETGTQLSWYMINTYLMIFYTDIVGLTAGAISLIMLVARVWQGIAGPAWGIIQDRVDTKWGKFRPYLLFLPVFLGIFNVLTFTVFPVTGILKVVLCLVCYILAGTFYIGISNAYSALVNVIARDSQVRMNYSSARSVASSVIGIILSAVAMPMILFFSNGEKADASGYFWTTVVCTLVMIPSIIICGLKCKEVVEVDKPQGVAQKTSISQSFKLLAQNKMLLIVVLLTFFGAMGTMLRMSMLAYFIIYVLGSYQLVAPVFTTMTVMQLVGSMALPLGTKFFGKKMYMLYNNIAQIVCMLAIFFLPSSNTVLFLGLSAIIGFTNAAASITFGMMSDSIEYGDWKYGIRNVGLSVSTLMLAVNISTAITGSVGVLLLAATGYVAGAVQTPGAMAGINMLVNLAPALLATLSAIILLFYKLDGKMLDQIAKDLDARKTSVK